MVSSEAMVIVASVVMLAVGAACGWGLRAACLGQSLRRRSRQRRDADRRRQTAGHLADAKDQNGGRTLRFAHEPAATNSCGAWPLRSVGSAPLERELAIESLRTVEGQAAWDQADVVRTDSALVDAPPERPAGWDGDFLEQLADFNQQGGVCTLLVVAVDRLASTNDGEEQELQDDVLDQLATALRRRVRTTDVVTRYGSDRIAVVLFDASLAAARNVAGSLAAVVKETPFTAGEAAVRIGGSIGLSEFGPGDSIRTLIYRVETALRAARERGRNWVCWHDGETIHAVGPDAFEGRVGRKTSHADILTTRLGNLVGAASPVRTDPVHTAPPAFPGANGPSAPSERRTFALALGYRLREAVRRGDTLSVMLARIDDFESIRARHGLRVGNQILDAAGAFFIASVRKTDWVARLDMTTFAFLLPNTSLANALCVAERLRKNFASGTAAVDGNAIRLTISLGATEVAGDDSGESILCRAEEAVREAGEAGGSHIRTRAAAPREAVCGG